MDALTLYYLWLGLDIYMPFDATQAWTRLQPLVQNDVAMAYK